MALWLLYYCNSDVMPLVTISQPDTVRKGQCTVSSAVILDCAPSDLHGIERLKERMNTFDLGCFGDAPSCTEGSLS